MESLKHPSATREKRGRGRPNSESPKVTMPIRFSAELIAELDEWIRENGEISRSAAIRIAVTRLVRGKSTKKLA